MLAKADSFGERLRVARTSRGIKQQSLGDAVGVSTMSIGRYESGAVDPKLNMVRRLAKALGVSAAELAGFNEEEE